MRVILIIAMAVGLSGCLANMTPAERAAYDQRVREIQAQQAANPPPVLVCNPQLPATCVNVFGVPQRVENVPLPTPPRQTTCTTNIYGNTAYTTCQ